MIGIGDPVYGNAESDHSQTSQGWSDDRSAKQPKFPIGTVAHYGPNDKTTTKIVAGVLVESK